MGEYGLGIDQISTHRSSAHGVALYDKLNFAAPTCTGCHGSHAALPPNVNQITDVCGHCHVLVRRALDAGPHGVAARNGLLPGCTACHSNHGTERIPPDRIASTCTVCHDADSPAALGGIEIQQQVIRAIEELHSAEEAISELRGAGHRVDDVSLRLHSAQSAYLQVSQTQHSLDLEVLEDLTRQVASVSADIRATAEVAAEHQWEHKLLLVPVWFLALSAITLAWFKLRGIERRR
jgi:hypothetical protein